MYSIEEEEKVKKKIYLCMCVTHKYFRVQMQSLLRVRKKKKKQERREEEEQCTVGSVWLPSTADELCTNCKWKEQTHFFSSSISLLPLSLSLTAAVTGAKDQ